MSLTEFMHELLSGRTQTTYQSPVISPRHLSTPLVGRNKTSTMSAGAPIADMGGTEPSTVTESQSTPGDQKAGVSKKRASEDDINAESETSGGVQSPSKPNVKRIKSQDPSKPGTELGPTLKRDSVPNQTNDLAISILMDTSITGYERHKRAPKFFNEMGHLSKTALPVFTMRNDKGEPIITQAELDGRSFFYKKDLGNEYAVDHAKERYSNGCEVEKREQAHLQDIQTTFSDGTEALPAVRNSSASSKKSMQAIANDADPPTQSNELSMKRQEMKSLAGRTLKKIQGLSTRKLKQMEADVERLRNENTAQEIRIKELEAMRDDEKRKSEKKIARLVNDKKASEKRINVLGIDNVLLRDRDEQRCIRNEKAAEDIARLNAYIEVIEAAAETGLSGDSDADEPTCMQE